MHKQTKTTLWFLVILVCSALIGCILGAIIDGIVNVKDSLDLTYYFYVSEDPIPWELNVNKYTKNTREQSFELSCSNGYTLYIDDGIAHLYRDDMPVVVTSDFILYEHKLEYSD